MVAEARESEEEEDEDEEGAGAAVAGVLLDEAGRESQCDGRWSGSSLSRDSKAWMI